MQYINKITSPFSHLVLSSSAGSQVTVSGALNVRNRQTQYCEFYILTGSNISATTGIWYKPTGNFETGETNGNLVPDSTGSISYVGDQTIYVDINSALSVSGSSNGTVYSAAIFKNGVLQTKTINETFTGISAKGRRAVPVQGILSMNSGDSISVRVRVDQTSTINVLKLSVIAKKL
jgi:hypothetical protein